MSQSVSSVPSAKKMKLALPKATQSSEQPFSLHLGFIGSGNMARAIVEGVISSGKMNKANLLSSCTSENSDNYKKMKALGVAVTTNNHDVIISSDVIVIAVKPHQVLAAVEEIQTVFKNFPSSPVPGKANATPPKSFRPLVVSVAAAITIQHIEQKTELIWNMGGAPISGHLPVIRCIPTMASAVRAGVTVYARGKFCNDADILPFLSIFSLCGHCEEIPETCIDAFTAFSGSGVAFMALVLQSLTDGGVLVGIPRDMAERIAAHTMISTAKIVMERKQHPSQVVDATASPGGTTIYGIQVLEEKGLRAAIMGAVKTATDRAKELRPKDK